jgi:hypothetical protein
VGETWTAYLAAIQELTDMEQVDEGNVQCRLEQVTNIQGRRQARISLKGSVRGVNEDGPNRQDLSGFFYFDLQSRHLSYLYLQGISSLLDRNDKTVGRIEGQFVLTRRLSQGGDDLDDAALKSFSLEPTPDNTLLLYDNAGFAGRFLYPRRWRPGPAQGSQATLDGADGSGVLITLEPQERLPTGTQYLSEVRDWLQKQKAKIARIEPPRKLDGVASETFTIQAEVAGQKLVLSYFVVRFGRDGATLAGRLPAADDAAPFQADMTRIARSLEKASSTGGLAK